VFHRKLWSKVVLVLINENARYAAKFDQSLKASEFTTGITACLQHNSLKSFMIASGLLVISKINEQ